jgi:hypothetical protein
LGLANKGLAGKEEEIGLKTIYTMWNDIALNKDWINLWNIRVSLILFSVKIDRFCI